ncbi:MAG: phosphotransferase [Pseudomonadota bacterium]
MSERMHLKERFLKAAGWQDAQRNVIAGDASNRRYERLAQTDRTAILLDAPPETGEQVAPFLSVAGHLARLGVSTPKILFADPQHGYVLLEDLGDDLFARVLKNSPAQEHQLYKAAVDLLVALQAAPVPDGFQSYDAQTMTETALLLDEWYLPAASGTASPVEFRETLSNMLSDLLESTTPTNPVIVHRDFHAENLLWLPNRRGIAAVGVLDFQDAMAGSPVYDLASLLADARRDVSQETRETVSTYFLDKTGHDPEKFQRNYAIVSVQRNLRIMGVFARLCVRDKKRGYPDLMPRVWANLKNDLQHPAMTDLASLIDEHVPTPSQNVLRRIKSDHV